MPKAQHQKNEKMAAPICLALTTPFETSQTWCQEEWESIINETLSDLRNENEKEKDNIHPLMSIITRDIGMELLWKAVDDFELSLHCKYMAIDLFHKFLIKQLDYLVHYVAKASKEPNKKEKMVKELERRIKSQSPLRALTCLMIASKLASHRKILNAKQLHNFIKKIDMNYSITQIIRSEARVLEQLKFRCSETSSLMVYVGVLVDLVGLKGERNSKIKSVPAERLFEVAMCLLDIALLHHNKLYNELFFLITGSRVIGDSLRSAFARVIADKYLLAAATVIGGGWTLGGDSLCSAMTTCINSHTHLPVEDLESMTACLLYVAGFASLIPDS